MKDPNLEPEEEQHPVDASKNEADDENNSFHKHQMIDEEGNELDPEDIK